MVRSDKDVVRVLFVCLGNICRSPMAEAVFAAKVAAAGLTDRVLVDSAGTGDWHVGQQAHSGTRRMLAEKGIAYSGRARHFTRADLSRFDYILTMDDDNLSTVLAYGNGTAIVRPFMEFAPQLGLTEVPDPYFSGNFTQTYKLVDAAADGLLDHIRKDLS